MQRCLIWTLWYRCQRIFQFSSFFEPLGGPSCTVHTTDLKFLLFTFMRFLCSHALINSPFILLLKTFCLNGDWTKGRADEKYPKSMPWTTLVLISSTYYLSFAIISAVISAINRRAQIRIFLPKLPLSLTNNSWVGCRDSSVDLSLPRVWVPSTPSMLFSIYIVQIVYLSFELDCEKNENKQKEAGIGPFFKIQTTLGSSSRQRGRLLFWRSEFKSRQRNQFLFCLKIDWK